MLDDDVIRAEGRYQYVCRTCGYASRRFHDRELAVKAQRVHRHRYLIYRICGYQAAQHRRN